MENRHRPTGNPDTKVSEQELWDHCVLQFSWLLLLPRVWMQASLVDFASSCYLPVIPFRSFEFPPFALGAVFSSEVKVTQSCLTLCEPMDYTVHGILQARILEWVAFSFSRGYSQPRNWTGVSCIAGVHWVSDAIQPSHPLSSPSPLVFNLSQHHRLFKWVSPSQKVAK